MAVRFASPEHEAAHWKRIVNLQADELDAASARLRSAWIERDRLRALLAAHGIPLGTPTPESVPLQSPATLIAVNERHPSRKEG